MMINNPQGLLKEVNYPRVKVFGKNCGQFHFESYDDLFLQIDETIAKHPGLHVSHYLGSIFFKKESLSTDKPFQVFMGFEVIGQNPGLAFEENFILKEFEKSGWLSSEDIGEYFATCSKREFLKKVFNFLDNLHNKAYPQNDWCRVLVDFKPSGDMSLPKVFIQMLTTGIDNHELEQ